MKVRGIVLSDDLRKEASGKDIIIGAYTNVIITPSVPLLLPIFTVRLEFEIDKLHYDVIQTKILRPDKDVIQAFALRGINFTYLEYTAVAPFQASPMIFEQVGEYEIHFGMDTEPEKVGSFFVVLAEQSAPKA